MLTGKAQHAHDVLSEDFAIVLRWVIHSWRTAVHTQTDGHVSMDLCR